MIGIDRANADLLIAEIGSKLGIADLTLDTRGETGLAIDNGAITLRIAFDDATGGYDILVPLSGVEPSPTRLQHALSANFCWRPTMGGTFGLDRARNELSLRWHCPGADLDAAGLLRALDDAVAQADAWTTALAAMDPAMPASADAARTPMDGGLRG